MRRSTPLVTESTAQPSTVSFPFVRCAKGSFGDLTALRDAGLWGKTTVAVAVPIAPASDEDPDVQPRAGTADIALAYELDLSDVAARARLSGKAGESYVLLVPMRRGTFERSQDEPGNIVLVGVGDECAKAYRRAGAALARATRGMAHVVTSIVDEVSPANTRAFVEGFALASYRQPRWGLASRRDQDEATTLTLLGNINETVVQHALIAARATWLARNLANTPSNFKNPQWMVDCVLSRVGSSPHLRAKVWDENDLATDGFGGILAVGAASSSPPRLVQIDYTPPRETGKHVVIVGKGITFDTGGLSLKPRDSMVSMKTDMAGAAVAFATIVGAAERQVDHHVTVLLPLAENAIGASSYRPSDVISMYGGTTVEVANTDAEGRLVLADALAYACERLEPDVLIDVATLTGAATLGLGKRHAALFTRADELADHLSEAATKTGEQIWRMPLIDEYRGALDSKIADLCHIERAREIGAGAVVAALFLESFVGTCRWAHLDIAGTGRASSDEHEVTQGATGYGASLLLRWLESR